MTKLKSMSALLFVFLTSFVCLRVESSPIRPFKPELLRDVPVPNRRPLSISELAARLLPSVVQITVRGSDGQPFALGSGFVISKNLIATNIHVIEGAHVVSANYLNGRSEEVFGPVAFDPDRDLTILYTDTKDAKPLPIADEGTVHVGDSVVALGSPKGFEGSVSSGIVSALRVIQNAKVVQTTAPISHGSSGGPLLNMYGEVVGVTSFTFEDGENLNFAYSASYLKQILPPKITGYFTWKQLEPEWKKREAEEQPAHSDAPSPPQPAPSPVSPSTVEPPDTPAPSLPLPAPAISAPAANNNIVVWVNTSTGVYHYPGSRWYGKTKEGKYMKEPDALAAGFHSAGREKAH